MNPLEPIDSGNVILFTISIAFLVASVVALFVAIFGGKNHPPRTPDKKNKNVVRPEQKIPVSSSEDRSRVHGSLLTEVEQSRSAVKDQPGFWFRLLNQQRQKS